MGRVDVRVRAPAGLGWGLATVGFIGAAELLYELNQPGRPELFGIPFTPEELWPAAVVCAAVAAAGIAWLLMVYLRPGRITLDGEPLALRRVRRGLSSRVVEAPLERWRITGRFFSRADEAIGRFKRLQLEGPDGREVFLYDDVAPAEQLWAALREHRQELGGWDVQIEQS